MTDGKVHLHDGTVLLDNGKVALCDDDCCFGCVDAWDCDSNVEVCECAPQIFTVDLNSGGWGDIADLCGAGLDSCCALILGEYDLELPGPLSHKRWWYGPVLICDYGAQEQELYMVFCPKAVTGGRRMQLTITTTMDCVGSVYTTVGVYRSRVLDESSEITDCFTPYANESDEIVMDLFSETSSGSGHACTTGMPATVYIRRKPVP